MKYIFDFDDVLFHNTEKLKPRMYKLIAEAGIPENETQEYYQQIPNKRFVIKNFLQSLFDYKNIKNVNIQNLYSSIMDESKNFKNDEVLEIIKKIGKDNCYIVTHGETEHQLDKINRAGIVDLFSEIFIVQGSKKEAVEKICSKHAEEDIVFIDDKAHHFDNLDFKKYPNLKTILYTGQDLNELLQ
jgi:FMN phosphatase YigB (HAD superfamily)